MLQIFEEHASEDLVSTPSRQFFYMQFQTTEMIMIRRPEGPPPAIHNDKQNPYVNTEK